MPAILTERPGSVCGQEFPRNTIDITTKQSSISRSLNTIHLIPSLALQKSHPKKDGHSSGMPPALNGGCRQSTRVIHRSVSASLFSALLRRDSLHTLRLMPSSFNLPADTSSPRALRKCSCSSTSATRRGRASARRGSAAARSSPRQCASPPQQAPTPLQVLRRWF